VIKRRYTTLKTVAL